MYNPESLSLSIMKKMIPTISIPTIPNDKYHNCTER